MGIQKSQIFHTTMLLAVFAKKDKFTCWKKKTFIPINIDMPEEKTLLSSAKAWYTSIDFNYL